MFQNDYPNQLRTRLSLAEPNQVPVSQLFAKHILNCSYNKETHTCGNKKLYGCFIEKTPSSSIMNEISQGLEGTNNG